MSLPISTPIATDSEIPVEASQPRSPANGGLNSLAGKLDSLLASYDLANQGKARSKIPAFQPLAPATVVPELLPQRAAPVASAPIVAVAPALAPAVAAAPFSRPAVNSARLAGTAPAALSSRELEKARVMIVDDEEANVLTVKHHLSKEGFRHFICTTDPRESLAMLRTERPDVLLLDIKMPHISGIDILRAKGLDQQIPYTPVLILTATVDPTVKREALELGAYDFLTKPVDPNDLIPRVRNAVVVKRHFDQISNEAERMIQPPRQMRTTSCKGISILNSEEALFSIDNPCA